METPRSRKSSAAAVAADGLNALDRDRASSLADEGGASASAVEGRDLGFAEGEEGSADLRSRRAREARARLAGWPAAMLFAAGAVAAWGLLRRRRGRA